MDNYDTLSERLLGFINHNCGHVFSTEQATIIGNDLGISPTHVGKLLTQMTQRNTIMRVDRGLYVDCMAGVDAPSWNGIMQQKRHFRDECAKFEELWATDGSHQDGKLVELSWEQLFDNATLRIQVQNSLSTIMEDVAHGGSIILLVPNGVGKTLALQTLVMQVPDDKVVGVVEMVPELRIEEIHALTISYSVSGNPAVFVQVNKNGESEKVGLPLTSSLIQAVLACSPDVLVVGEVCNKYAIRDSIKAYRQNKLQIIMAVNSTIPLLPQDLMGEIRAMPLYSEVNHNWLIELGVFRQANVSVIGIKNMQRWQLVY